MARRRDRRDAGAARGTQRLLGIHSVREALRARRRPLRSLHVRGGNRRPELMEVVAAARALGVPVEETPAEAFPGEGPGDSSSQGVFLEVGPLPELGLEELLELGAPPRTLLALDGVEDPQNLGAIARVAEAAGVLGLVLTRRRSPPLSPAVARASAGAIEWLPVARVPNLSRAINLLKGKGFWVFGSAPEAPQELFALPERLLRGDRVIVLGAEGRGLRRGIEQVLDYRIRIPMQGRVASLNVSSAAAVVLFEFLRRSRLESSA